jgi:hypothetical protein
MKANTHSAQPPDREIDLGPPVIAFGEHQRWLLVGNETRFYLKKLPATRFELVTFRV